MDLVERKIGRFDQVRIRTTVNVTYLSAPPGTTVSPKGIWSVCAIVGDELLLAKQSALIRIPATDVLLVADYNVEKITRSLGRLSRGKEESEESKGDSGQ